MKDYTIYEEYTNTIVFTSSKSKIYYVFISGEHYAKTYDEWKPFLLCKKVKAKNKFQAIINLEHYLKLKGKDFIMLSIIVKV